MTDVRSLETPCLVVDPERLARNIERMEQRARELGVRLRPHLKTAKSKAIAERIPSVKSHGATVSTIKEAEYFAGGPATDLLYAVTVTPARLERIAGVVRTGVTLRLSIDSVDAAEMLQAFATSRDLDLDVLVEIDSGEHRSGLTPDDPELDEVGKALLGSDRLRAGGVFTHGGHSYGAATTDEIRGIAEAERASVVEAARVLETAGIPCPIRSVGSTPTAMYATHLDGCTELRAGVFVFQDLFQSGLGSCSKDDIALSVLTSVIGRRRREGTVLVDAGGLALSKDRSTASFGGEHRPELDCGYGLVADEDGQILAGLVVVDAYQEHGIIAERDPVTHERRPVDLEAFPLGRRLRILPNHSCMTAAAYAEYQVPALETTWARTNAWASES